MTINIMNEYIELVKKQINSYIKLVFGNKFNKNIVEEYNKIYINIRYNNFYEKEDVNNTIRKKILNKLKETQENLVINDIENRELIENICIFYYYVLYFDNVVYYKDLAKIIEKIEKLRKRILKKQNENFKEELYNEIEKYNNQKIELLEKFQSNEFFLKITSYSNISGVYRVNLKYDIKFPMIYSEFAIEKAFHTGITNEDKLIIEYYLTTVNIIKDIIRQNFKKQYIVEFAETLFKKSQKIKNLLNIIQNVAIQDKINLKIRYEQFLKNKEEVYELMKQGFKIAVIIDNSFEINFSNLEKLNMFSYIIINKNLKHYEEIIQNKIMLHNVIEI